MQLVKVDFFVLTALPEESEPLLSRLGEPEEVGSGFCIAKVITNTGFPRNVLLYSPGCGQGTNKANTITTEAIVRYRPRIVLLVGIAAGFFESKVCLGDVIVPEHIDAYELAKKVATEPKVQHRQPPYNVTGSDVITEARVIRKKSEEWYRDIKEMRPDTIQKKLPDIHAPDRGVLGSGDKNLADEDAEEREYLIKAHGERALGAEMEAAGVATACIKLTTPYAVIKGVQDDGTLSKDDLEKKDLWRAYAADAAAALVVLIMRRLNLENISAASEPIGRTTPSGSDDRIRQVVVEEIKALDPRGNGFLAGFLFGRLQNKLYPSEMSLAIDELFRLKKEGFLSWAGGGLAPLIFITVRKLP